ncbi:hypothetical protein Ppro_0386 [Pelobacter propionicus DSM 2379]|uniref:Uncharacterized protein n=1 Tax=Pelobacter propionicus (strain DSM 2379 / NBRC 103807 / OttBd1) TaxID=338966 RepID=A1AL00_PELPD|nr:hypothetical protein Ppro_0386 [Pelobacter propionicus DSM 2379]
MVKQSFNVTEQSSKADLRPLPGTETTTLHTQTTPYFHCKNNDIATTVRRASTKERTKSTRNAACLQQHMNHNFFQSMAHLRNPAVPIRSIRGERLRFHLDSEQKIGAALETPLA